MFLISVLFILVNKIYITHRLDWLYYFTFHRIKTLFQLSVQVLNTLKWLFHIMLHRELEMSLWQWCVGIKFLNEFSNGYKRTKDVFYIWSKLFLFRFKVLYFLKIPSGLTQGKSDSDTFHFVFEHIETNSRPLSLTGIIQTNE